MERPKFQPIFTKKSDYCEKSSSKPIKDFVPHQAISLKELVTRFERGQRLNVHCNFSPGSNLENMTDDEAFARIRAEGLNGDIDNDDFPPTNIHDITDVESYKNELEIHKREFSERMKKKREEAKQAKQRKAQQAQEQSPTPPAPPVE